MLPVMQALDADKNGELSTEEIENAVAALKALDKDKNGKLTEDEMLPDFSQMMGGGGGRELGRAGERPRSERPTRPPMEDDE